METILYEVVHALILMLVGAFLWKRATRPKYRWKCPAEGCEFSVSSTTDPGIVTNVAERHTEGAHQDG